MEHDRWWSWRPRDSGHLSTLISHQGFSHSNFDLMGYSQLPLIFRVENQLAKKKIDFAKATSLNCAPESDWLHLLTCKSHRKCSKYSIFDSKCGIWGDFFALERFRVCIRGLSKIQHRNSLVVDLYLEQSRFKWRISYHLFALCLALWRVLKK